MFYVSVHKCFWKAHQDSNIHLDFNIPNTNTLVLNSF